MDKLENITDAEYRKLAYESYSSIKYLLKGPEEYFYQKQFPFQGSPSCLLGTAIHNYLQGNRHLVAISRISRLKKKEFAEFESDFMEATNYEGIIVPLSFEEKLEHVMINFNDHLHASEILKECKYEIPFLFEFNGVKMKGKVDGISEKNIVEIKTSSMAKTVDDFRNEAYVRDYDLQAFLYCIATGRMDHLFVVANTTEPYGVNVYRTSKKMLESGEQKARICTENYKRYIERGEPFDCHEIKEL